MEPQYVDPNATISQGSMQQYAAPALQTVAQSAAIPSQLIAGADASTPIAAEDSDTIEAEWVAAIKRTTEQYKDDPYVLSQAMAALRQDYLQKRYGKTIEAAK